MIEKNTALIQSDLVIQDGDSGEQKIGMQPMAVFAFKMPSQISIIVQIIND